MNLKLDNCKVLVTGGSKGIGRAIVKEFLQEGARVSFCGRNQKDLDLLVTETQGKAFAVKGDVSSSSDVKNIVQKTVDHLGGIDILVNNAGGAIRYGAFLDLEEKDWINAFQLNVMSVVYMVQECLPFLKKSKNPRILNLSSIVGTQPGMYNPHYSLTKAAVINLSKSLSNTLIKDQIRVNTICPGPVETHAWEVNIDEYAKRNQISRDEAANKINQSEAEKIPLGRIGHPEDISSWVAFLASEKADWTTGSCFHVSGGKLRSMD